MTSDGLNIDLLIRRVQAMMEALDVGDYLSELLRMALNGSDRSSELLREALEADDRASELLKEALQTDDRASKLLKEALGGRDRSGKLLRQALEADDYAGKLLGEVLEGKTRSSKLLGKWWSGIDFKNRGGKGRFVTELLERMSRLPCGGSKGGTDSGQKKGMNQNQIAEATGMSPSALTEAKKGAISDEKVGRLIQLAKMRGVPLPRYPELSADIRDNVSGMISAMALLSQSVDETNDRLDENGYLSVRAVLACEQWRRALCGCTVSELPPVSELFEVAGVDVRHMAQLVTLLDQWLPAFLVVLEHLDAAFYYEGS